MLSMLKIAIREYVNFDVTVNQLLLNYCNSIHSKINGSPSKLMYNRQLRTRLNLLRRNIHEKVYISKINKSKMSVEITEYYVLIKL